MSSELSSKLLVNIGSVLAANGIILLVAPRRFSVLRTSTLTPQGFNQGLERLTDRGTLARGIGALAAVAGITMVTYGLTQVKPR